MSTRILIIDDNVSLTTLLGKTLARFGFEPHVENNSLMAIDTVQRVMPDIILLDVMMPERDGGKVLGDLRTHPGLLHIPVILLTGMAREAQALSNLHGVHSPVVAKPVELKTLIAEIDRMLRFASQRQNIPAANGVPLMPDQTGLGAGPNPIESEAANLPSNAPQTPVPPQQEPAFRGPETQTVAAGNGHAAGAGLPSTTGNGGAPGYQASPPGQAPYVAAQQQAVAPPHPAPQASPISAAGGVPQANESAHATTDSGRTRPVFGQTLNQLPPSPTITPPSGFVPQPPPHHQAVPSNQHNPFVTQQSQMPMPQHLPQQSPAPVAPPAGSNPFDQSQSPAPAEGPYPTQAPMQNAAPSEVVAPNPFVTQPQGPAQNHHPSPVTSPAPAGSPFPPQQHSIGAEPIQAGQPPAHPQQYPPPQSPEGEPIAAEGRW